MKTVKDLSKFLLENFSNMNKISDSCPDYVLLNIMRDVAFYFEQNGNYDVELFQEILYLLLKVHFRSFVHCCHCEFEEAIKMKQSKKTATYL